MKEKPIKYIKSFGFKLWCTNILILIFNKFNIFKRLKEKLQVSKNKQVIIYLENNYNFIIDKYNKKSSIKNDNVCNTIWVFWWQGIENAPDIVKSCINSIKRYCKDKEIVIIDKNNIDEYYQMPSYISDKVDNGAITVTHLSDILRMNLLKNYGGYWIDATIFLTDNPFNKSDNFTTIKFHCNDDTSISKGRWCGFFIGGENKVFYEFMVEFFNNYWKQETLIVDYFLIDYVINIAYNRISYIKKYFDSVNFNNENIHKLQSFLNKNFNEIEYNKLLKANSVHKLSYKENIDITNKDNYYNNIINNN